MKVRHRAFWSVATGVIAGLVVVAGLLVLPTYVFSHVKCEPHALGNVTAWTPVYVEAAPYRGSVSVTEHYWLNTTRGTGWMNDSGGFSPITNSSGNVTAGDVAASNWTIVQLQNASVVGPGSSTPCATPLVALHGSPWEWMAGFSPTMATNVQSDQGLPTSLNTSWLCRLWSQPPPGSGWYPPTCPQSSTFNVSFTSETGIVNTCGLQLPKTMTVAGPALDVKIPFTWNGRDLEVPAVVRMNPGEFSTWAYPGLNSFGTSLSFTYSFPVNGAWTYDNLADSAQGGSGLVFSYSSCSV